MEPSIWQSLSTPGSAEYQPLRLPIILFEIIYRLDFILFPVYLLVKVFKKSANAPKLFIIFFVINLIVQIIDTAAVVSIKQSLPQFGNFKDRVGLL